jgi:putative transposase
MNEHGMEFSWQQGYGAFSVSASNLDTVKRYIADPELHHRKKTYEQEFEGLLIKHRIPYDPKYVFG